MNDYRSHTMWEACLDLSESDVCAVLVGRAEPSLRRLSERRSRLLFTQGLYVYAEPWGSLVIEACRIVARSAGYTATMRAQRDIRYAWRWLEKRYDDSRDDFNSIDLAYWTLRQAGTWKCEYPGTMAVAFAADRSDHIRNQFARWIETATR